MVANRFAYWAALVFMAVPLPRIKKRRTAGAGAPRRRRNGAAAAAQSPPRVTLDASWEAIVAQLLATPSDSQPYQAPPDREYVFARKLGIHINRPPTRRSHDLRSG